MCSWCVVNMILAVSQLRDMNSGLLRSFLGVVPDLLLFLVHLLISRDLILKPLCLCPVFHEGIHHSFLDFIDYPSADFSGSELVLCLAFKNRILHFYRYRSDNTVPYFRSLPALPEILVDAFENTFLEGREMRTSISSMLTIDV